MKAGSRSKGRTTSHNDSLTERSRVEQEHEPVPTQLRILPTKQDTLTLSYHHLKLIPQHPKPQLILHLHLSHNQLTTLIGLERYSQLESLNVSHNRLQEVSQLERIPQKHRLVRLAANSNQFEYGYQKKLVSLFRNLQALDHKKLPSQQEKDKIREMSSWVSNHYVGAYSTAQRLIDFLSGMLDNFAIKRQLKQRIQSNSDNVATRRENSKPSLKLLHENLPQSAAIELHRLYAQYNSRTDSLSESQQLKLQQRIVKVLQEGQIKCTCRPLDFKQEMMLSFSTIFDRVLLHFSNAHDNRLLAYLKIQAIGRPHIDQQRFTNDSEYSRERLLFEYYNLAPAQSHFDTSPGRHLQKVNVLLLQGRSAVMPMPETNIPKGELRTVNADLHVQRLRNLPLSYPSERRKVPPTEAQLYTQPQYLYDQLIDRIPVFQYCKPYSEVLSRVLLEIVFKVVNIHSQILADRHSQSIGLQENSQIFEYTFDKNQFKENNSLGSNLQQQQAKPLTTYEPFRATIANNPVLTVSNSSPLKQNGSTVRRQQHTQPQQQRSPTPMFVDPTPPQQLEDGMTVEHIHEISLKYKVLQALLTNSKHRKTLLKR